MFTVKTIQKVLKSIKTEKQNYLSHLTSQPYLLNFPAWNWLLFIWYAYF